MPKTAAGANNPIGEIVNVTVISWTSRIGSDPSVVDNAAGDPTFIVIAPRAPVGG